MSKRLSISAVAVLFVAGWSCPLMAQGPEPQRAKDPEVLRFGLAADTNISRREKTTRHWIEMIGLGEERELDFIVVAGDIVNNPKDEQQWDRLGFLLREHDFRIETVPGNHDALLVHDDRSDISNRVFSLERYEQVTGVPGNRAFRYANAYFITMYSGGLKKGDTLWAEFLVEHLAIASADDSVDWIFVVDHMDPRSVSTPHAFPRMGGFDREKIIGEAVADLPHVVWLSGDLSSRFQHQLNENGSPRAEFIPRENRAVPAFWQFDLKRDGSLTARRITADNSAPRGVVTVR